MKNLVNITFLIFLISILIGCSSGQSYDERMKQAKEQYNTQISQKNKDLVQLFFEGRLKQGFDFEEIDGGFYCMWKTRDIKIEPHMAVNKLFVESGYEITLSPDSLKYIIVSESKSHKVGSYTNNADAVKLETIISVIDLQKELVFNLVTIKK